MAVGLRALQDNLENRIAGIPATMRGFNKALLCMRIPYAYP